MDGSEGSVLGPLLFILHTLPLSHLMESHLLTANSQIYTMYSIHPSQELFHFHCTVTEYGKPNISMDVVQPPLSQHLKSKIRHHKAFLIKSTKSPTLQYTCPVL